MKFFWNKKTKSNIYIGDITVVPRSGLKKGISDLAPSLTGPSDNVVEDTLCQLLDLPPKPPGVSATASDLALDVIVPEYDFGEFMLFNVGAFNVPFIWKPHITITGRLYEIGSGATIYAATVKHTVSWLSWGKTIFSLQKMFRIKANMSNDDVRRLTIEAATKLLSKILKNS